MSAGIGMVPFAFGPGVAGPKRVTVVYDGDTLRIAADSVARLPGIDASEMVATDRGLIEVFE